MKDVLETLQALQDTPVPNLLVIAGIVFLVLAFFGEAHPVIRLPRERQRWAAFVGALFLTLGIGLSVLPRSQSDSTTPTAYIFITEPHSTVTCKNPDPFCLFQIEGTAGGVKSFSDFRIYTFVFPLEPRGDGWYLQRPPASIRPTGYWTQSPAQLGTDETPVEAGDTFQIRAALVQADATFRGNRLGDFPRETILVLDAIEDIDGIVALSDLFSLTAER